MSTSLSLDHAIILLQDVQNGWLFATLKEMPLYDLAMLSSKVLGILFIVYYLFSSVRGWYRLRHFSGHFSSSFSYIYLAVMSISGRSYREFMSVNRKYGPLARVGPNELITSDVELIRQMGSARSQWARSAWYNSGRVHPVDDTILNVTNTSVHDKLRHDLIPGYSGRDNALENDIDDQLVKLIQSIRKRYISTSEKTRPLEFVKMSQYFTVDTMTQISFGKPFGCMDVDGDVNDILDTVEKIVIWGEITANVPMMQTFLSFSIFFDTFAYKLAREIKKFNTLAEGIVAERFSKEKESHKDMLGSFIKHGFSQRLCELQVPVQLTAGTETTATAIRSTLLHILTSPTVYRKLQKEIDDGIAAGLVSSPISFREAKDLPYVSAIVYEGLRMHPPFTGLLMKEVPAGGYVYSDGRTIPAGTFIGHNTWQAMRDKEIFGGDADMFRPERFVEASPETRARMRSAVDLVFGYGRWQCMGRPISMMELHKVFVELLRNFDMQIMNPYKPIKTFNVNLFLQTDMWVRVTERDLTPKTNGLTSTANDLAVKA